MTLHPFLQWPDPLAFAHRGGTGVAPENTMAAFEHAVGLGYTFLETDVHATTDGVLVAFHDPDLNRTCGVDRRIDQMTWAELSEVRVDGTEPIPRFDELVEAFPTARWNVDCKADSGVDALVAAIKRHRLLDRVCVGSFSDRRLFRLRRILGSDLCTSIGPAQIAFWRCTGRSSHGAACAQIPTREYRVDLVTEATVARSRIPVIVWTIDDPDEIGRLLDIGVAGIMTDRPATLKDVLVGRGQWAS